MLRKSWVILAAEGQRKGKRANNSVKVTKQDRSCSFKHFLRGKLLSFNRKKTALDVSGNVETPVTKMVLVLFLELAW